MPAIDAVKASFEQAREAGASADKLNLILWSDEDLARRDAEKLAESMTVAGSGGRLAGVPVAVKDNIATLGLPTTCASRILAGYVSPFEATAVTRLRHEGAIVVAKTNMDEFAMGSSNENSAHGPARNPHDLRRVPGGSSGGSAAAVAAGIVPLALGSETGGSVRQPAAFCGVVGVKPSYGRVSRYGLVAFASSLDQIGPLARNVDDAAMAMEIISGVDPKDSTSAYQPVPAYREQFISLATALPLQGVTIGVPLEYFPDTLDAGIRTLCERSFDLLRSLGAKVVDVSLPHTPLAVPVYYILAPAEASSNLARFDGVRYGARAGGDQGLRGMYGATRSAGFGPEVTRRILLGTYVLSAGYYDAYYRKAQAVRSLITADFTTVFDNGIDALFTPTTPTTAFLIGAVTDPYEMYLSDIFTVPANLAGVPAISIPIGRDVLLPVGGQIIAARFDEAMMFRVAYALEAALGGAAHQ
ncbi:MAG: Asp-tRNA(Asn)/Glu-tRNA(Gln) amidotransferase subunit GatA [Gemmatimonadaceae bacterium]|nr:Asp-tRNA(Asn)/Glu-tRNA(Gln) amidotransferase subunit GatA [Gemmatimonadaceae bacterium]MDQ3244125.1 Asp-tRNA(Asn)/Glu-tRNA(Gln) amidotransferase subunit GatA [Gemmatimonadota bacterium]